MKILKEYTNGNYNVTIYENGTKIKETINPDDDHFETEFPDNIDLKITDRCPYGCKYCHENSTPNGKIGDIMNLKFVDTYKGGEMAIGGGSVFEHPDLKDFLKKLKSKNIIANLTVNQRELKDHFTDLMSFIKNDLIHGLGVSLVDSSNTKDLERIDLLGRNVVLHVINGIVSKKDMKALKGRKVLVLGFKDIRRGKEYHESFSKEVQKNMDWLKKNLKSISDKCDIMSFDCLAIKQLDVKNTLNISDEFWNIAFQGDDYDPKAASTMFVDAVKMEVARASTEPIEKRIPFKDESIDILFKKTLENL